MKVRQALAAATARLGDVSATPLLDAELLMAHALGVSREELLLQRLEVEPPALFEQLIDRRLAYEPVAYITGRRAFWTIELAVGPGVLIPRPDSETLIEAAVEHFGTRPPASVLDLGTGSGALLLAALDQWPEATGIGVDRSEEALEIARANAERLGLAERALLRCGDWADPIDESFDLLLCNPPYVEVTASLPRDVAEWEPHSALFAGSEGLDDYRRLAPQTRRLLKPGGVACFEVGAGQAKAVGALFEAQGLSVSTRNDLGGIPRCIVLRS